MFLFITQMTSFCYIWEGCVCVCVCVCVCGWVGVRVCVCVCVCVCVWVQGNCCSKLGWLNSVMWFQWGFQWHQQTSPVRVSASAGSPQKCITRHHRPGISECWAVDLLRVKDDWMSMIVIFQNSKRVSSRPDTLLAVFKQTQKRLYIRYLLTCLTFSPDCWISVYCFVPSTLTRTPVTA